MARAETHGENSPYFAGWKAYDCNPYDPMLNPSGIIQMGLAENQVCSDLLEEWIDQHPEALSMKNKIPNFKEVALHQDYHGLSIFRKALARFMEEIRGGRVKFDPDKIVLTAGATAANEILTFCIANPGDALLIPTPYYPGFDRDLRWRTGAHIIPVHCTSKTGFEITLQALEQAYQEAQLQGKRVKALLITNPSNPLGQTLKASAIYQILDFVSQKSIHLICDEIYSGTVFNPSSPFVSISEIIPKSKNTNPRSIHTVYSLSKDLGVPGFRVGTICSQNDEILSTSRRMSSFSLISSQTQAILTRMLLDIEFMRRYMVTSKKRLREMGIECLEGGYGLFRFVNLRHLLERESWDGEIRLWEVVLNDVGLNVSPGSSFHCEEPRWFRVCFGNMSQEALDVALQRIRDYFMVHGKRVEMVGGGSSVERERERERESLCMHVHEHASSHITNVCV
ncbi:hypothetical protein AMTRI_Chr13g115790 [Amborella trichopoda]